MKSTILLTLIALPFALAGPNNKARASSPDISASIANFRSVLDPKSSVISPRDTRQLNKPAARKCKDLKGWRWCWTDVLRRSSFEVAMGEMGIEPSIR
ncbi:hypothetical protein FPSE_09031 [Fusarium pseudograminearum CS3096]|uniref:Uncharacterized protein n=1 Tax=Fusarium pseudograminearum (strain CS3096) TaxID=1028729 RepID=K3VYK2_FUSPC|nr:hypothetical protein FPSE_09031 [Fusarium pseudograminearum CS3096]EKJ70795.1 hypothetical protein FPSE_09031 [Fusarium pseudograminearum CS3096]